MASNLPSGFTELSRTWEGGLSRLFLCSIRHSKDSRDNLTVDKKASAEAGSRILSLVLQIDLVARSGLVVHITAINHLSFGARSFSCGHARLESLRRSRVSDLSSWKANRSVSMNPCSMGMFSKFAVMLNEECVRRHALLYGVLGM